jgi:hypothetical protein
MGIIEALIIGAAIYFGLGSIADAVDNVAVGIEDHGIQLSDVLATEIINEVREDI